MFYDILQWSEIGMEQWKTLPHLEKLLPLYYLMIEMRYRRNFNGYPHICDVGQFTGTNIEVMEVMPLWELEKPLQYVEKPCQSGGVQDRDKIWTATPTLSMLPSTLVLILMSQKSYHYEIWKTPLQDLEKPRHSGCVWDSAPISIATPTLSLLLSTPKLMPMLWESCHCQNWKKPLQYVEKPCHSGGVQDKGKIWMATPTLSLLLSTPKLMPMSWESCHHQNWKRQSSTWKSLETYKLRGVQDRGK